MQPNSTISAVRIGSFYKILFICFVSCGLYYPSLFSQFNSIDDSHIIAYLETTDSSLLDILLPGNAHYYRPIIWLTFFFDKYVWGLEPSFMHLENIVIHAANAVLVYLLAVRLAGVTEQRLELPFLSALLFAAHPINTEAVCWIAGRTDPLATIFILLAACFLAGPIARINVLSLTIPAGLIFLGCLVKEVAFFFFPVAALAALWRHYERRVGEGSPFSSKEMIRPTLPFILFPLVYLYLRQSALPAQDKSVDILITQKTALLETATAAFRAFGFYAKKLLLPYPLNFAIVSYSNAYVWIGIAVLVLGCWLMWRKRPYYFLLGAALFLIFPAVVVAVKPIAWTPVAERYLYAPSAFFVLSLTGMLSYVPVMRRREYFLPLFLMAIIIVCAFMTVQRNLIWQDNYLLYKDAVAKSPQFARIRNEYGIALALKGDTVEASKQFEAGQKFARSYSLPVLNLANMKFREGKNDEALKILTSSYKKKSDAAVDILKLQAKIYEELLFKVKNVSEQKMLSQQLVDTYHHIYLKDKDPYLLYRSGQLVLHGGEPQRAAILFENAFNAAPDGSFYKLPAKKLADKLKAH